MRMEELEGQNYIKGVDTVEKYLLNLVKQYFENTNEVNANTKEYIIRKAVNRMKEELNIDNAGVVSVNGMTGPVTINCETLGAEPYVYPKGNAYNKNFGNSAGTVCEGNDPRLNDKRKPLPHTHAISDIDGLTGKITSIENYLNTLSSNSHTHSNKSVLDKIRYSGDSLTIDLAVIEQTNNLLDAKINEVDALITAYTNSMDAMVAQLQAAIDGLVSPAPIGPTPAASYTGRATAFSGLDMVLTGGTIDLEDGAIQIDLSGPAIVPPPAVPPTPAKVKITSPNAPVTVGNVTTIEDGIVVVSSNGTPSQPKFVCTITPAGDINVTSANGTSTGGSINIY